MYRYFLFVFLLICPIVMAGDEVYQSPKSFLIEAFSGDPPAPSMLWLTPKLKEDARTILAHAYIGLRVRYWLRGGRSAWVLEEIGKEKPITVGLVVEADRLEYLRVLVFRESRGWEVRHGFFTEQFARTRLDSDLSLDKDIDGISGATLSVRALTKLARLALLFHRQVSNVDGS
ncbi:MAG: FMN-binding protein [Chromatiales bacterium]|nr:FMN-binding protein [Chromatiales bacterium]